MKKQIKIPKTNNPVPSMSKEEQEFLILLAEMFAYSIIKKPNHVEESNRVYPNQHKRAV